MSRKRVNKNFHISKGKKDDLGITPLKGCPNTYFDTYNKSSGKFVQRRKFGADGNAFVDLDIKHCVKYGNHAHDIVNGRRSLIHRNLTKKEKRELRKAKKKRRFFK